MKKYKLYLIYWDVIMIKVVCSIFLISGMVFAGAPPVDDKPLPAPPYTINNINKLTIALKWDKNSIEKLLDKKFTYDQNFTGGITIFNSKEKTSFSPFSGAFAWVNGKEKESGKHIIFSTYGPNELINKIMNRVYNVNASLGSNKVTLINDNASARTSIRKKNVVSLSAKMTNDCVSKTGSFKILDFSKKDIRINNYFSWQSEKVCVANSININTKGLYKGYKIREILWAKTYENVTITFDNPLKLATR